MVLLDRPADGVMLDRAAALAVVRLALAEDLGGAGDLTSAALIPEGAEARGVFLPRERGVLAGLGVVELVFSEIDRAVEVRPRLDEGQPFEAGQEIAVVRGPARSVLTGERVALNFLQRLCGIATLTRAFTDAVAGTSAAILDTRKTTPGLRLLEKDAVRAGGGQNHRMGLYDQAMVKDNHLAVLARRAGVRPDELDLGPAVAALRERKPDVFITIEATTLRGVERALEAGADTILLDNMPPEALGRAVALVHERTPAEGKRPLLEASGGVRLENVKEIAATGVDRVSVGALTHGARAIDIALEIEIEETGNRE